MVSLMSDHVIAVQGHTIDLDRLYPTMYRQSRIEHGVRVYNGNRSDTTAIK